MAGDELICHVIKVLYYFLEFFLFKQVQDLVDGAPKSLLKNKVFALCSMLAGGGLIHCVMKVNLFWQCLTHEWSEVWVCRQCPIMVPQWENSSYCEHMWNMRAKKDVLMFFPLVDASRWDKTFLSTNSYFVKLGWLCASMACNFWKKFYARVGWQELVDGASKQPLISTSVLTLCNMMTVGELICHAMKELYYFILKFYVQTGAWVVWCCIKTTFNKKLKTWQCVASWTAVYQYILQWS